MASVVSSEGPQRRTPAQKKQAAIFVAILALPFANMFLQRATLVDQLPIGVTVLSGFGGLAFGLWMSLRLSTMPSTQSETRRIIGLTAIPIFSIFIGTYLARTAAAELAFVGYNPAIQVVEATVTDFRRGSKWPGQYASFKVDHNSREIEVKVTPELHDSLDPWRSPGRDCLMIQVQRGRGGLRRTVLPNLSFDEPLGVEHYRRCSSAT
jgi:hypothetical protein